MVQTSPPFEDTSNWVVDPAFEWGTNGRDVAAETRGSKEASDLRSVAGAGQALSADVQ